jgi:hypothetical protein
MLDSSSMVLGLNDNTNANGKGSLTRVTISGSTLSWGTPHATTSTADQDVNIIHALSSTRFLKLARFIDAEAYPAHLELWEVDGIGNFTRISYSPWTSQSNNPGQFADFCAVGTDYAVIVNQGHGARLMTKDTTSYVTTVTTTDAIPTNVATIEPLPINFSADLESTGTPVYQNLDETYEMVNSTTGKATATLSGDEGIYADIKVTSTNTDLNDVDITRVQADFLV